MFSSLTLLFLILAAPFILSKLPEEQKEGIDLETLVSSLKITAGEEERAQWVVYYCNTLFVRLVLTKNCLKKCKP